MKIRITGTEEECKHAAAYFSDLGLQKNIAYVDISKLYPNRYNSSLYRLYVEVVYKFGYDFTAQDNAIIDSIRFEDIVD